MSLTPGTRLGIYEITALIGVGGMGEVYKATDTNLKRAVAIKVLPASLAGDADRLARFQREAEVLAALNHPNIAAIYGLERTGDMTALVMELVEGDDLSQRIAQGAIPADEALPIAKQIAEALEAAHEQGIIHRDLKPANIKVRSDGTVKVLDFGLAKAMEPAIGSSPNVSQSPTITTPVMTQAGMILGTAAYMSPEQARGKTVDRRADVWAFGAVLFEMFTGRRAFAGGDVQETFVAIMRDEPDWTRLPATLSATLATFIRRCLHKDLKQRVGDIHDVRLALEGAFETTVPHTTTEQRPNALVVSTLAVAAAAIAVAGWLTLRPEPIAPPRLATRFRIAMPPNQLLINRSGNADGSSLALSPDGSRLVYSARQGADNIWWQLYTRSSDRLDAVPVRDGQVRSSVSPFFSPSGDWIGFERDGKIMKVPAGGGAVLEVCDVPSFSGATWLPDDSIVFGTTAGLMRVSAVGGTPTPLTKPDGKTDSSHRWPAALPGGKAIVFSIQRPGTNFNGAAIGVLRLDTGQWTVLVEGGTAPHYLPSGHLAFVRNGVMLAMPFDVRTLQASGTAVPLVDGIFESVSQGSAKLAVANTGTIAYVPAQTQQLAVAMVWVDRHGAVEPVPALHQTYETPRLSPDGQRVAVAVNNAASTGDRDIWLYDISRATLSRFTTGTTAQAQAETPAWTPDGRRVTYATGPVRQFVWKAADGSGTAELLASTDRHLHSGSWSPSGDAFISAEVPSGASRTSATRSDGSVWIMHKGATWTLDPYLKTAFPIRGPVISPDGRWLAYTSSDNNRSEIYVQTFPKPGGKSLVSTDGGTEPVWARNGRELFYRSGDKMMAVSVDNSGSTPKIGKPTLLFQGSFAATGSEASYDVSVDGQRFLMLKSDDAATSESIVVIQDWMNEVKALVSRGK